MRNGFKLQNMVAVITGAGSGIGRALAKKLAAYGCSLALADIDPSGLRETMSQLPSFCRATSYKLDVADREAYRDFVKQVVADHRQVDILINNAGIVRLHSIQAGEYDDYEASLNVNVWGVLHGCKEFLPYLKMRPQAWLVNMSSGAGLFGCAHYSSYNMSKFAVRGLTESLRNELRGTNVTVGCVYPGGVATNLMKSCIYSRDAAGTFERLKAALKQMSADRAAEIIVKGMLKKQGRIVVGRDVRLLEVVARLFPASYDLLMAKLWSSVLIFTMLADAY